MDGSGQDGWSIGDLCSFRPIAACGVSRVPGEDLVKGTTMEVLLNALARRPREGRSHAQTGLNNKNAWRRPDGVMGLVLPVLGAIAMLAAGMGKAEAVPSFARQTGQPCEACHMAFPQLTPFGRRFKLDGYTLSTSDKFSLPVAAMAIGSFTHTKKDQSAPPEDGFKTNDNFALDEASLFYAGKVYGDLGAFVQVTYDGLGKSWELDNTDVRYAKNTQYLDKDLILGVDVNNNPTVQDVWNTTPAWGYPQFGSGLAPEFSPPEVLLQESLGGQVVGVTGYGFWNDMVYGEAGGYFGLSDNAQSTLGTLGDNKLSSFAPYGRFAVEKTWDPWDLEVGAVGMYAKLQPDWNGAFGTDNYGDLGFDAQLSYMGKKNRLMFTVSDIMEWQQLNSTYAQGGSSNLNNHLNVFNVSATWVYNYAYSLSAGYFNVSGSSDPLLYADGATPGSPMGTGNPGGSGLIFDVSYMPFMKGGPKPFTTSNVRLGLQYTHYLTMYGGTTNFDGNGNSASDNDTVYLYMVAAF